MKRLLLLLVCALAGCARSAPPLPGDSVGPGGSVSLASPPLRTNVTAPPAAREPLSPIEARLFPPELIIENKKLIGLSQAQQDAITKEVDKSQTDLVKLQWELQTKKDDLVAILGESKVDEAKSAKAADALMQRENAIKSAHLAMLVRIKNQLTPAQQERLASARETERCAPAADAGAP